MITNEQRDLKLEWYYNSNILKQEIRSYEVSLWTLQDEFITVLKWSDTEQKGRVEKPIMTINIDGTQNFECTIPMYINFHGQIIENPNWYTTRNGNLITDLRKIKVILNKGTEDEGVFEFVITNITETHDNDQMTCNVSASGLAFHELGRIGYKINLSQETFQNDLEDWEKDPRGDKPEETIQYWLKKMGIESWDENDFESSIWYYDIQMDWSSFRKGIERDTDKIYEEAYTTVWSSDLKPLAKEEYKEKWRPITVENSNIYNITQDLAEKFGVFCRYEYLHDENYHIIGRKIIFYNNFIQEGESAFSLTYPYSSSKVSRTLDSTDLTTKLYVLDVDNQSILGGKNTIMNAEANGTHEDYLLNFEYLYQIGAINQEQYDAIHEFNVQMREFNEELIPLQESKSVYENKKVEVEAQKAIYEKGQDLASEQITQNQALRNEVDIKDGNADGLITRTADNPQMGTIVEDTINGNYISLAYGDKGIKTDTVKIYREYSSANKTFSSPITNFYFEYDEYGNPIKIRGSQIVKSSNKPYVYMIYDYEPQLYYDAIVKIWQAKYAQDHAGFLEQSEELDEINETLSEYEEQEKLIEKAKRNAIKKFDAMMGPALREGYWQPEDYIDYGNQLSATLTVGNTSNNTTLADTDTGIGCEFGWDTILFDGEEDIYYQQGVEQTKYYYPCINLSSIYSQIADRIDEYSFIFNNNYYKTDVNTDNIQYTQNFQIGSQAIVRFVKQDINIIPVLILLGAKPMTEQQINFMKRATTNNTPGGNPRIGIFTPTVNTTTGAITVNITNDINVSNPSFWQFNGADISTCQIVYPRIKFSSLDLKVGEGNIGISYNNNQLNEFDDYYVKSRVHPTSYKLEYIVTLQPQSLIQSGATTGTINIDYVLSNANTQIYLDAMAVMKENSMPKVSYEVSPSIIDHARMRTLYQKLAHLVMINDSDLKFKNTFGYISEIKLDLEEPQNDSIEVKNYKTKFEDLFSNIVAQTESMKCVSGQVAAMVQGKLPLNVDGLAGSLEGLENLTFFNSFLDNYISNSTVLDEKLTSLFTEASEVLSSSNKALQQVHTLSTKNAGILNSFASNITEELTVKVFRQETRPEEFKVGDVWIRVNEWGAEQARYVAVVSSSEQLGMAATAPGFETSGFIRTYDGTLASITGAGLSIDAYSGDVTITARNRIDIQSGNDIEIKANSTVNIYGNDAVNIGGTTINIGSTTIDGSTVTGGVNIIATAYTELEEQYGTTEHAKVLIHPDKIEMGGSSIIMRGDNKIQMITSRGNYTNTSAIEISPESGVWIGSGKGVTIFSGDIYTSNGTNAAITGAEVSINSNQILFGVSDVNNNSTSVSAVEITKNYIIMAVGQNVSSLESANIALGSNLTGVKITKDSIGMAVGSGAGLSVLTLAGSGINIGTGQDPTNGGTYVSISGAGITVGSSGKIAISTTNFLLDTSKTDTDLMLRLGTTNDAKLSFSMTNGLVIKGAVTATSLTVGSGNNLLTYDSNNGLIVKGKITAITLSVGSGNNLLTYDSSNGLVVKGKITATTLSVGSTASGNTGMTYDSTNGLVIRGKIYATSGEFSGSLITGTLSADHISGGTLSGISLNIGNGNCVINSSGQLSATGASIGGTINATDGSFGPWSISSTKIYGGSGTAYTEIYPGGIYCDYTTGYVQMYITPGSIINGVGFGGGNISAGVIHCDSIEFHGKVHATLDGESYTNQQSGSSGMSYTDLLSYLNDDDDVIAIITRIARAAVSDNNDGKD